MKVMRVVHHLPICAVFLAIVCQALPASGQQDLGTAGSQGQEIVGPAKKDEQRRIWLTKAVGAGLIIAIAAAATRKVRKQRRVVIEGQSGGATLKGVRGRFLKAWGGHLVGAVGLVLTVIVDVMLLHVFADALGFRYAPDVVGPLDWVWVVGSYVIVYGSGCFLIWAVDRMWQHVGGRR